MGRVGRQLPVFVAGLLTGGAIVALAFLLLPLKQDASVAVPEGVSVREPAQESEPVELSPPPFSTDPKPAEGLGSSERNITVLKIGSVKIGSVRKY